MTSINTDTLLAAIRECVTVVAPGEVLAVRVPFDIDPDEADHLASESARARREFGVTILFMPGDEFARLTAAEDAGGTRRT